MKDQDKSKEPRISALENLPGQVAESGTTSRSPGNGEGGWGPEDPQWHSLVANTPVFILILDRDGCIRFANHTDSGATPDQIIGKNLCDFCTPENRAEVRECLQRVFRTGEPGLREGPGLRLDHEEHWYASYYGPIFQDGKVIAVSLISFRISDRKRAEDALQKAHDELEQRVKERTAELAKANEQLRQTNDELQSIYDGMADGFHILNLETLKAVRSNPAMCRMMGYSQEELLSLSQAEAHPREKLPGILERFQAHAEGRASLEMEVPMLRKDGSVFYADVTTSRILYNETPCLICFFRDRTERRQAEAVLEQERQSLWKMLQASDHERQIISYEIHDGLAQYLAAAVMQFQAHDCLQENSPVEARKAYETAVELVARPTPSPAT